jgi:hypothetical protein
MFNVQLTQQLHKLMTRYFVAANVWLILAVIVFLGRTFERDEPPHEPPEEKS